MNFKVHAGQIQGWHQSQEDEPGVIDTGTGLIARIAGGFDGQSPAQAVCNLLYANKAAHEPLQDNCAVIRVFVS